MYRWHDVPAIYVISNETLQHTTQNTDKIRISLAGQCKFREIIQNHQLSWFHRWRTVPRHHGGWWTSPPNGGGAELVSSERGGWWRSETWWCSEAFPPGDRCEVEEKVDGDCADDCGDSVAGEDDADNEEAWVRQHRQASTPWKQSERTDVELILFRRKRYHQWSIRWCCLVVCCCWVGCCCYGVWGCWRMEDHLMLVIPRVFCLRRNMKWDE